MFIQRACAWGNTVAESGIQLLETQKPIKMQGWWKGKLALFWRRATWGRMDSCPEAESHPALPHWHSVGQNFYSRRRRCIGREKRLHVETAPSSYNWSCSGLISVILIVSKAVSFQFQGQFIPVSLRPVLRIVAAYVMATFWSSGS